MKRLLFITHHLPPRPGIASVRAGQIVRYLPDFGWDVTVLTASFAGHRYDGIQVFETPEVDLANRIKRVFGLGNRSIHSAFGTAPPMHGERKTAFQSAIEGGGLLARYGTNKFGWYMGGISTARRLMRTRGFDAVLSTSPPESAHVIASSLAHTIPWVADFRDLWINNSGIKRSFERKLNDLLEPRFMRRARHLITVSEPLAADLRSRYTKPVSCIPNAFDASEWARIPFGRRARCTIMHAGYLYDGRRNPTALFDATSSLLQEGAITADDLEILLFTPPQPWLSRLVADFGLENVVSILPPEQRESIMALERSSDLLWIILFDAEGDAGVLTGKLFEYLGARRPILVTGGPAKCAIDEVLLASGAGVRTQTKDALRAQILAAIARHNAIPELPAERAAPYEARHLVRRLSAVLDRTAGFPITEPVDDVYAFARHSA